MTDKDTEELRQAIERKLLEQEAAAAKCGCPKCVKFLESRRPEERKESA